MIRHECPCCGAYTTASDDETEITCGECGEMYSVDQVNPLLER